jgi:hypothetical protein
LKGTIIDISKIILLWRGQEKEFLQYHVLRDQIKIIIANSYPKGHNKNGLEVEERTIMRYLQSLVTEHKLEKKIEADHSTYYRPVYSADVLKEIWKNQIENEKLSSVKILLPEPLKPSIEETRKMDASDKRTVDTIHDIVPGGKAPVDVSFSLDSGNKDKLEATRNILADDIVLGGIAYDFVASCQRAILNATENGYKWEGYKSGPLQIRKMVERVKTSLDFDATLSFHFDGKRLIEKYDWEKDIRKYEETVKAEHETWPSFVSGTSKTGVTRDSWIDWCISEKLYYVEHDLEVLNNSNHVIAKDTSSLITQFAECIVALKNRGKILHEGPTSPTVEDAKKHIEEMLNDGTLEIAVTFKVNTEKIVKRQKEAATTVFQETGYTLP